MGDLNDFIEEIEEMLLEEKYEFASKTLEGIKATVANTGVITEGQRRAVSNIKDSKSSGIPESGRRWNRRYEGR